MIRWAISVVVKKPPDRALFAQQADEADPTQEGVAIGAEAHDEIIGSKLAGRQALDIQVSFEFAVKLFSHGIDTIEDDKPRIFIFDCIKTGPPGLRFRYPASIAIDPRRSGYVR